MLKHAQAAGRPRGRRLRRFEIPVLAAGYATLIYWTGRGLVYLLVLLKGN